jgi:hypothetical protein
MEERRVVIAMRPIHRKRSRGSTMALYATFLALVGIPLLALNIDVARVYVAKARLRSATQAACQAYGSMLDTEFFQGSNLWRFKSNAMGVANTVFFSTMGSGSINITASLKGSGDNQVYIVDCRGDYVVSPIMWVGVSYYKQTQYAQVKVKFSTTSNWMIQGSEQ